MKSAPIRNRRHLFRRGKAYSLRFINNSILNRLDEIEQRFSEKQKNRINWGTLISIIVAIIVCAVGIYSNLEISNSSIKEIENLSNKATQKIQQAIHPNNFSVKLYDQYSKLDTGFISPQTDRKQYIKNIADREHIEFKALSKRFELPDKEFYIIIHIYNKSKFISYDVPVTLMFDKECFADAGVTISKHIDEQLPVVFGTYADAMFSLPDRKFMQLRFQIPFIDSGLYSSYPIELPKLERQSDDGYIQVNILNNLYIFQIVEKSSISK